MIIPVSTDTPIYHLPFATAGLIVCNLALFISMATGHMNDPESWILTYGSSLTPLQWITSTFMHADIGHLLGNMVFLGIFGLIVEGKLGWWRFLLCYFLIGGVQSAGEQTLMLALGGQGGSLGASSIIYGLMAMAAIWAPKNEVSFFYFFWFILIYTGTAEVPILTVAAFYIGIDIASSIFLGFHSSSWLHVGGVLVGAPLGVVLLKLGMVDCEGWDLFHIYSDKGNSSNHKKLPAMAAAQQKKQQQKRHGKLLAGADQQIAHFLQQQNYEAAYKLHQKMAAVGNGVRLPRDAMLRLIAWLHQQRRWRDSCPLMAEFLSRFPQGAEKVRIKLAQICVVELDRPGKALDLAAELDLKKLSPDLVKLTENIVRHAKQQQQQGVVELDHDQW
jgi:membrane associated rhomboid family serine protease